MKLNLQIITPEKIAYQGEADFVSVPTDNGEITILPKHVSLVSTIKDGALTLLNGKEEIVMAIYKGFIEVHNNQVIIMTDIAERIDEIDREKVEKAKQEAQKKLSERDQLDEIAFAENIAILEKSLARLKATRKKRR